MIYILHYFCGNFHSEKSFFNISFDLKYVCRGDIIKITSIDSRENLNSAIFVLTPDRIFTYIRRIA